MADERNDATERPKSMTPGAPVVRNRLLSLLIATAVASLVGAVCATAAGAVTFNVTVNGTGEGVVSGSGINCDKEATPGHETCTTTGFEVQLTATPESGSAFGGWSVSAGEQTPNPCAKSLTCKVKLFFGGPSNITATFNVALPPPTVAIQAPTAVGPHEATFHGSVNPNGNDATWRYEYRVAGAATWTDAPVPDGDAGAGVDPEPVSVTVGSLEANTEYEVRLQAANATAEETSGTETFHTPGEQPTVGAVSAWSVSDTTATLAGTVNPNKSAVTDCSFEYGPTTAYGLTAPCSPSPGAGNEPVQVMASIGGLSPGMTYHARLIVGNSCGEGCGTVEGDDSTFSTRSAAEVAFPNRGYELVSAADTNGITPLPDQSSPDGKDFIWLTYVPAPGSVNGNISYFRAQRGPDGAWTQGYLGPPAPPPGEHASFAELLFSADDLSTAGALTIVGLDPADQNRVNDAYLVRSQGGPATWISRNPAIPPETPQTEAVPGAQGGVYVTRGGGAAFFVARRHLLGADEATQGNLYEWSDGRLVLVGVPPGPQSGAVAASTLGSGFTGLIKNAVSSDSSRVVFTTSGASSGRSERHIYIRVNPMQPQSPLGEEGRCLDPSAACTLDASASQPGVTPPVTEAWNLKYWGASATGSRVVFTSGSGLTVDSGATGEAGENSPADLYMYEPEGEELRDLTPGVAGGAGVSYVFAVSEDGRRVYFSSTERLAGQGREGVPNIYLAEVDPGGHVSLTYIATGSIDQLYDREAFRETVANPSGSVWAFRSAEALVPGENTGGRPQVYVYERDRDELSCASCLQAGQVPGAAANLTPTGLTDPSVPTEEAGAGPVGASVISPATPHPRNVAEDGTVFFQTATALVPSDTNGQIDVYEWRGGKVALISGGLSSQPSVFGDASTDGTTVFFRSAESLVPGAQAGVAHIYAARVGGGTPETPGTPRCSGQDCRASSPASVVPGGAASAAFVGPGNVHPRHRKKARRRVRKRHHRSHGRARRHRSGKKVDRQHHRARRGRGAR